MSPGAAPLATSGSSSSRIDCALPPPQFAVDPDGTLSAAWWACIGAVHSRTGGGEGIPTEQVVTALAAETEARIAGDTTLTTNLAAETVARANADTSLTTALASETSARIAADTTLQANINALARVLGGSGATDGTGHASVTFSTPFVSLMSFVATPLATSPIAVSLAASATATGADVYASAAGAGVAVGFYWAGIGTV